MGNYVAASPCKILSADKASAACSGLSAKGLGIPVTEWRGPHDRQNCECCGLYAMAVQIVGDDSSKDNFGVNVFTCTSIDYLHKLLNSTLSNLDKFYQFLHIIKVIIIPINPFPMIYNPSFFIFLKTIKKFVLAISFDKQGKSIWLDFT